MAFLCIYDKTSAQQTPGAFLMKYWYPDTVFLDISKYDDTTATDEFLAVVDAITATYDQIYILCPCTDTGGNKIMNFDTYARLRVKLTDDGTTETTGTSVITNSDTSHLQLSADAQANDYYNGMVINSTGGTGTANIDARILDYVNADNIAEIGGAAWTDPAGDTTYEIYDLTDYIIELNVAAGGKDVSLIIWEYLSKQFLSLATAPTPPLLFHYLGAYKFAEDLGLSPACTGTTLKVVATAGDGAIIADGDRENDIFNDMWVCIVSAATGAGQVRQITDYVQSTELATVATWDTTPTTDATDIYYRIHDKRSDCFRDYYMKEFFETYMTDITDGQSLTIFQRLIDESGNLKEGENPMGATVQNLPTLYECLSVGKHCFDALSTTEYPSEPNPGTQQINPEYSVNGSSPI